MNKASMIFRYYFREHFLDSSSYDFFYNIVGGVAKGDCLESIEIGGVGFL